MLRRARWEGDFNNALDRPFSLMHIYTYPSGTYATVNLAYTISSLNGVSTYKQVACKMLKMTSVAENTKIMREVELLKGLDHVRCYSRRVVFALLAHIYHGCAMDSPTLIASWMSLPRMDSCTSTSIHIVIFIHSDRGLK